MRALAGDEVAGLAVELAAAGEADGGEGGQQRGDAVAAFFAVAAVEGGGEGFGRHRGGTGFPVEFADAFGWIEAF